LSQIALLNNEQFPSSYIKDEFNEDIPCPNCAKVCPNDSYCINCGYIYDPILRKHQTQEQLDDEKIRLKQYQHKETKDYKKIKLHSKMVKIGKEYKRQHGRVAVAGDIVRRRNQDGSYDKGSVWYIKINHGWRSSPSTKRKPSKSQIKRVCNESK